MAERTASSVIYSGGMDGITEAKIVLTPREREVVALIADGMSAKDIGRQMNLSPRTVERHIETSRCKLRAQNKAQLVANALAVGLIEPAH
jgi:DNA-binding CsgD family transcriptional regulator